MVYRAVRRDLEVLGRVPRGGLRVVEGVDHADAFDRLLWEAVKQHRGLDARGFEDRRDNVNDVVKLRAQLARGFDALRPTDCQAVSRPPEVRRRLLGPI